MLEGKHKKLQQLLKDNATNPKDSSNLRTEGSQVQRVLLAFSGGVDSSVVAKVAKDVIGNDATAVTIDSEVIPRNELREAKAMANEIGIRHLILKHSLLKNKEFTKNPQDRCYYCKRKIMGILKDVADKQGIKAIMDGTNVDDMRSDRPGLRALREYKIISPLAECGIGKEGVRRLARKLKLKNYNRPEMTCLATRVPTGERITKERLKRIELAEEFLHGLGIRDLRVRDHGDIARIEVKKDKFKIILNNKEKITKKFKGLGFPHVSLDLRGRDG